MRSTSQACLDARDEQPYNGDLRETLLVLGRAALSIGFDDLVALVHYILLYSNEVEAAVLMS